MLLCMCMIKIVFLLSVGGGIICIHEQFFYISLKSFNFCSLIIKSKGADLAVRKRGGES